MTQMGIEDILKQIGESKTLPAEEKAQLLENIWTQFHNETPGTRRNSRWPLILLNSAAGVAAVGIVGVGLALYSHQSDNSSHPAVTRTNAIPDNITHEVANMQVQSLGPSSVNWYRIPVVRSPWSSSQLPLSPLTIQSVFEQAGNQSKHFSLSQARSLATFPVREPVYLPPGWVRIQVRINQELSL